MSFPLLTATAALPAIGAVATAAVPAARRTAAKWLALLFSLATLALAVVIMVRFDPDGDRYQLTESHAWISEFGVRYDLGVDGIGVALIALTAVLMPFVILAGWHDADPLEQRLLQAPVPLRVGAQQEPGRRLPVGGEGRRGDHPRSDSGLAQAEADDAHQRPGAALRPGVREDLAPLHGEPQ